MGDKTPKLAEIAARIAAHLHRMEMAQPDHGSAASKYWRTSAIDAGAYVAVCYVSYQGRFNLPKTEAIKYLAWLDAGNEGTHWRIQNGAVNA